MTDGTHHNTVQFIRTSGSTDRGVVIEGRQALNNRVEGGDFWETRTAGVHIRDGATGTVVQGDRLAFVDNERYGIWVADSGTQGTAISGLGGIGLRDLIFEDNTVAGIYIEGDGNSGPEDTTIGQGITIEGTEGIGIWISGVPGGVTFSSEDVRLLGSRIGLQIDGGTRDVDARFFLSEVEETAVLISDAQTRDITVDVNAQPIRFALTPDRLVHITEGANNITVRGTLTKTGEGIRADKGAHTLFLEPYRLGDATTGIHLEDVRDVEVLFGEVYDANTGIWIEDSERIRVRGARVPGGQGAFGPAGADFSNVYGLLSGRRTDSGGNPDDTGIFVRGTSRNVTLTGLMLDEWTTGIHLNGVSGVRIGEAQQVHPTYTGELVQEEGTTRLYPFYMLSNDGVGIDITGGSQDVQVVSAYFAGTDAPRTTFRGSTSVSGTSNIRVANATNITLGRNAELERIASRDDRTQNAVEISGAATRNIELQNLHLAHVATGVYIRDQAQDVTIGGIGDAVVGVIEATGNGFTSRAMLLENVSDIVLRNLDVRNNSGTGIRMESVADVTLENSRLYDNGPTARAPTAQAGIRMEEATRVSIFGNDIQGNPHGMYMINVTDNQVAQNTIADNRFGGIVVRGERNDLRQNRITANGGDGISGVVGHRFRATITFANRGSQSIIRGDARDPFRVLAPPESIVDVFEDLDGEGNTYIGSARVYDGRFEVVSTVLFANPAKLTALVTTPEGATSPFERPNIQAVCTMSCEQFVYVSQEDDRTQLKLARGRTNVTLYTGTSGEQVTTPHIAPNGTHVVFVSDQSGTPQLWLTDGSSSTALPLEGVAVADPAWSPDGRQLVFVGERDGQRDLYTVAIDLEARTLGEPVQLTNDAAIEADPHWSPDGALLAFTSDAEGTASLYTSRPDGTEPVRRTTGGAASSPAWSPEGTSLVYVQGVPTGGQQLRQLVLADGTDEALTDGSTADRAPTWTLDGERLLFVSDRDGEARFYSFDVTTQTVRSLSLLLLGRPDAPDAGLPFPGTL